MVCPLAAGLQAVTCDNQVIEFTDDEISHTPLDSIREPGTRGRYTERKTSFSFTLTVYIPEDQTIKSFLKKCNSTWTFQWASGRTTIMYNSTMTFEEDAVDVQTNKVRIKVISQFCEELLNQGVNTDTTAAAA